MEYCYDYGTDMNFVFADLA